MWDTIENITENEDLISEDVVPMTDNELNDVIYDDSDSKNKENQLSVHKLKQENTLIISKLVSSGEKSIKVIANHLNIPHTSEDERVKYVKTCRVSTIRNLKDLLTLTTDEAEIKKIEQSIEMWNTLILKEKQPKISRKQKKIDWARQIVASMMPNVEYQSETDVE